MNEEKPVEQMTNEELYDIVLAALQEKQEPSENE